MPTHKFHLGQPVEFSPPRGIYAPRGPYVVTAKLPERDGGFEYRVRSATESHERLARENELTAITIDDKAPETANIKKHSTRDLKHKEPTKGPSATAKAPDLALTVKQKR